MEVDSYWSFKPNPVKQALDNPLILENIFQFLSIEDYKLCRLVCWLWKDVREAEFKKKVRLCMDFYPKRMNAPNSFFKYPPPKDLREFFRNCQTDYPFQALKLSCNVRWSMSQLTELFANEGSSLTDVTFENVALKINAKPVEGRNVFVEKYPLMKIINGLLNLKSIHITCNGYSSFSLSLKDLVRFDDIHIHKCTIEMTENIILIPRNLTLEDNIFTRDHVYVGFVVLNSFVDFSEMKALRLISNKSGKTATFAINLTGNVKMETVTVINLDSAMWIRGHAYSDSIVNCENALWEIDTLSMYNLPFNLKNNMKIKRFHTFNGSICPSHLPRSLERLSISKLRQLLYHPREEIYMPNIKCLGLSHPSTIQHFLPFLTPSFPNLTELILGSQEDDTSFKIDVGMIPQSVNKIMIIQPSFEFVGRKYIDTLVVRNASIDFTKSIFRRFIPESHFFVFVDQLKDEDSRILLEVLTKQSFRRLIFGMFDLESIDDLKEHENFPNFCCPSDAVSDEEFFSLINESDNIIKCKSYKEIQKLLSNEQKLL